MLIVSIEGPTPDIHTKEIAMPSPHLSLQQRSVTRAMQPLVNKPAQHKHGNSKMCIAKGLCAHV